MRFLKIKAGLLIALLPYSEPVTFQTILRRGLETLPVRLVTNNRYQRALAELVEEGMVEFFLEGRVGRYQIVRKGVEAIIRFLTALSKKERVEAELWLLTEVALLLVASAEPAVDRELAERMTNSGLPTVVPKTVYYEIKKLDGLLEEVNGKCSSFKRSPAGELEAKKTSTAIENLVSTYLPLAHRRLTM